LAVVFSEPGGDAVLPFLQGGLLSTVNLAEVHTRLLLRGAEADFAWSRVMEFGCEICFFDGRQARQAAELVSQTRSRGLSLGDRACLALAILRKATVYTADKEWARLGLDLTIEVIR
jgi:PIN domain nuclease of toxin-antitoxin system